VIIVNLLGTSSSESLVPLVFVCVTLTVIAAVAVTNRVVTSRRRKAHEGFCFERGFRFERQLAASVPSHARGLLGACRGVLRRSRHRLRRLARILQRLPAAGEWWTRGARVIHAGAPPGVRADPGPARRRHGHQCTDIS